LAWAVSPGLAAVYRWDNGELITSRDLRPHASFGSMDLSYADFAGADLTNVYFYAATLTNAEFSLAIVNGADFHSTTDGGFVAEQFYSTASYQNGDLGRIRLGGTISAAGTSTAGIWPTRRSRQPP